MTSLKCQLSIFIILLCLGSSHSWAINGICLKQMEQLTSSIHLYRSTDTIPTVESLPLVNEALEKIDTLIQKSYEKGLTAEIYRAALLQLKRARTMGFEIKQNNAADQNQVYEFFGLFSKLIDLPSSYADSIGYYADGFDYVNGFTEDKLKERLASFGQIDKTPKRVLDATVKKLTEADARNLSSSYKYISIGHDILPDDLKFSFQYKYVFGKGVLPLLDLFQDRESGKVLLGVRFEDFAPHDGQNGSASSFMAHDLLHAYTQKYYDQLVFNEFRAKTLERKLKFKNLTHQLLTSQIKEYHSIPDKNLSLAIEAVYFVLLHEQSLSYPIGVNHELDKKDRYDFYERVIPAHAKKGEFGLIFAPISRSVFLQALEWVKMRSVLDGATVHRSFDLPAVPNP